MIKYRANSDITGFLKCGVSALTISFILANPSAFAEEIGAKNAAVKEVEVAKQATTQDAVASKQNDIEDDEDIGNEVDEIIVTGSRLRRTEFSSASPIQIIDGEIQRELGLFDATEILQQSVQSSGQQVDNSFTGFVLDGGAGSSQIGFRGLGPARTLVLLNSKRLAPGGVGGAPTAPDLNLIPAVMIERIENLFDGASTIYGSDAIAGVSNIILKKNIEGFELQTNYKMPRHGGQELTVSGMWGKTFDKGYVTLGAEYYERKVQTYAQSAFTDDCELSLWEDEDGNRLPAGDRFGGQGFVKDPNGCTTPRVVGRIQVPGLGWVYSTPGSTNVEIPGWSETTQSGDWNGYPGAVPYDSSSDGFLNYYDPVNGDENCDFFIDCTKAKDRVYFDGDGDGFADVDLTKPEYSFLNSERGNSRDFVSPLRRFTITANGEYLLHDDSNMTAFFDGYYAKRKTEVYSPGGQMFPWVDASNPYNPCNQTAGGVNCVAPYGIDWGDIDVRPVVRIDGDRDNTKVDIYQFRIMGGVRGSMPFLPDWNYETFASFSQSEGTDIRRGMLEANLEQSLDASLDGDGNVVCNDPSNGCVAVNLFSAEMMGAGGGTLTAEEDAFLFADRIIETKIQQTIAGFFIDGDLMEATWTDGTVPIGFGYEYRRDTIESNPNDVSADGLFWGYFNDEGADGTRELHEIFGETRIPIMSGSPIAEEMFLEASARLTDETFYDPAWTYGLKFVWRPTEWLTWRMTGGTSYRAPNLRERFLNGTSGFGNVFDPCFVPQGARITDIDPNTLDVYDPTADSRAQRILDSCRANGVDPTAFGLDSAGNGTFSTEVKAGGAKDLFAETSKSSTFGFVIEQPFTDKFDLKLSVTWFDIEIENSIEEPSAATIVDQCYNNIELPDGSSSFCRRITRDTTSRFDIIFENPINVGEQTSKGIDLNALFKSSVNVGDKDLDITVDLKATRMQEQIRIVIPGEDFDDNAGETEIPFWRGESRVTLDYGDWRMNWQTRFIGKGEEDSSEFDSTGDGCANLAGVSCRPIYYTEDYYVHNASLSWNNGSLNINSGVRNVFNAAPPLVGQDVFNIRNVPIGVGYDLFGRSFYLNVGYKF